MSYFPDTGMTFIMLATIVSEKNRDKPEPNKVQ